MCPNQNFVDTDFFATVPEGKHNECRSSAYTRKNSEADSGEVVSNGSINRPSSTPKNTDYTYFTSSCSLTELPFRANPDQSCEYIGSCPDQSFPLTGSTELPNLTVEHVTVNSGTKYSGNIAVTKAAEESEKGVPNRLSSAHNLEEDFTQAYGVTCKWKMAPINIDR